MDSWFREIYVPRAWRVYLATRFDFREKIVLVLGRSEPVAAVSYPGPRGFLLILSFLIWKFATRSADRSAEPRERKASGHDR